MSLMVVFFSIHDYLFEESVCLLVRAAWFEPLIMEAHEEALEKEEFYHQYQYDDDEDDLDEESYYISRSPNIRIGNRRWGDNGYVRGGKREAMPRLAQNDLSMLFHLGLPRGERITGIQFWVRLSTIQDTQEERGISIRVWVSIQGCGRKAREEGSEARSGGQGSAEKHLNHLQRLGLSKTHEVLLATAEVGPQVNGDYM